MENVGFDQNAVTATIHSGRYNHIMKTQIGKSYRIANPIDEFHLYQMDWTPTYIKYYVDGNHFYTYKKTDSAFDAWPFDTDFNIILNVAVGGDWGGAQGIDDSIFPTKFTVDYVRQYNNGFVRV